MTDKTDAWMPLWIGAYLADTSKLTTTQHGAYLLLLMAYWRERKALPDDDEDLRSIVKADRTEWKRLRPKVAVFFKVADGVWWHKRVEAEIEAADKRKASAVAKAQAGGQALAKKRASSAPSTAPSTRRAVLAECPTPSPSSLREERPPTGVPGVRKKGLKNCPGEFLVSTELQRWARENAPAVDIRAETAIFRGTERRTAITDWPKAWQVWMLREQKAISARAQNGETAYQRSQRERVSEMSGGLVAKQPPGSARPLLEVIHDSPFAIGKR